MRGQIRMDAACHCLMHQEATKLNQGGESHSNKAYTCRYTVKGHLKYTVGSNMVL